jgi:tRNA-dihydrouridine synthase
VLISQAASSAIKPAGVVIGRAALGRPWLFHIHSKHAAFSAFKLLIHLQVS